MFSVKDLKRFFTRKHRTPTMLLYLSLLFNSPAVIAVIFVSGIGGTFQYGYSVSVMTSASSHIRHLVNKTCVNRYKLSLEEWQVSLIWSFTVSIFCIGGLLGSLTAGPLLSKYGRKKCMLLNNFLAIFGAVLMIWSQTAMSFEMVMVGRFLYGINAGVNLTAHTMYVVECAPKRLRGMVGVTAASFTSFGRFTGQLLGIREILGTEQSWPWLLGFNGFAAIFQLLTLPFLPESPSFLLLDRGDRRACEEALKRLWGDRDYSREVEEMLEEKSALQCVPSHSVLELIQNKTVRWQLLTIIVTFITVQLCGINAVYFYSSELFLAAGIPEQKLPYAVLGTGLCELCTSLACFTIIENTGKRVLFFRGYIGMSTTLLLLIVTMYLKSFISWIPYCSMVLIFLYIFCYASGPGGITGPLPGQIFTHSFKSASFTVACVLSWSGLFTVGMIFPILVENLDYFCFLVFLFFCIVCGVYVELILPETKNRTALEISAEFGKIHSQCGRIIRKKSTEPTLKTVKTYETKL